MAIEPKAQGTDDYTPAGTLVLDRLPVMKTVELRRFASKKSDESGDDEDTGSLGIGSMTVADLAKLLDDEISTDEIPMVQDDETFV